MPQISPMDIVIIAILIFAVALILLGVDGVILLVESAQHRAKEV